MTSPPRKRSLRHPALRPGEEVHLALVSILLVQALIGYEWLMSGLTKVVRGGFPSGLADELGEKSADAPGWYKSVLDGSVIPNAKAFGVLIEITELAVGVVLVGAAVIWLFEWSRLSERIHQLLLGAIAIASLVATLMALNFHLANGGTHPWLIPADGFDEGIDLDSLLPAIQLVLFAFSTTLFVRLRRRRAVPATAAGAG